jgi:hypothetical protein
MREEAASEVILLPQGLSFGGQFAITRHLLVG